MKQKLVNYRVYDKKGQYHHSYQIKDDAITCAKHVNGSVKELNEEFEKEIFNAKKTKK